MLGCARLGPPRADPRAAPHVEGGPRTSPPGPRLRVPGEFQFHSRLLSTLDPRSALATVCLRSASAPGGRTQVSVPGPCQRDRPPRPPPLPSPSQSSEAGASFPGTVGTNARWSCANGNGLQGACHGQSPAHCALCQWLRRHGPLSGATAPAGDASGKRLGVTDGTEASKQVAALSDLTDHHRPLLYGCVLCL